MPSWIDVAILSAGPSVADTWGRYGEHDMVVAVNVVPLVLPGLAYEWLVAADAYTYDQGLANKPRVGYASFAANLPRIERMDPGKQYLDWQSLGPGCSYSAVGALALADRLWPGCRLTLYGFDMTAEPCIGGHEHAWTRTRQQRESQQLQAVTDRLLAGGAVIQRATRSDGLQSLKKWSACDEA